MGWFSGVVSGVKALFGKGQDGQSNVMKAASGIGNWIDEQNLTDQEKQEFRGEMIVHYGEFMKNTVNENTERSRSRRDIALYVIKVELFTLLSSGVIYRIDMDWAKYLYQIATESPLGMLTLGVGAFFFGTHLIRAAKN